MSADKRKERPWRPSRAQASILTEAAVRLKRTWHFLITDSSMNVLARQGMAEWHSRIGERYGRSAWWITDKGIKLGQQLASSESAFVK